MPTARHLNLVSCVVTPADPASPDRVEVTYNRVDHAEMTAEAMVAAIGAGLLTFVGMSVFVVIIDWLEVRRFLGWDALVISGFTAAMAGCLTLFAQAGKKLQSGVRVALDDRACEVDGDFRLNGIVTRGAVLFPWEDVESLDATASAFTELHVASIGLIEIGRAWVLDAGLDLHQLIATRLTRIRSAAAASRLAPLPADVSVHAAHLPLQYASPSTVTVRRTRFVHAVEFQTSTNLAPRKPMLQRVATIANRAFIRVAIAPIFRDSFEADVHLPAAAVALTSDELWVISPYPPARGPVVPKVTRYPRSRLRTFRRNRFGGGIYVRVEGEFAGDLPIHVPTAFIDAVERELRPLLMDIERGDDTRSNPI